MVEHEENFFRFHLVSLLFFSRNFAERTSPANEECLEGTDIELKKEREKKFCVRILL